MLSYILTSYITGVVIMQVIANAFGDTPKKRDWWLSVPAWPFMLVFLIWEEIKQDNGF